MSEPQRTPDRGWRAIMWASFALFGIYVLGPPLAYVIAWGLSFFFHALTLYVVSFMFDEPFTSYILHPFIYVSLFVPYIICGFCAFMLGNVDFGLSVAKKTFNKLLKATFVIGMGAYLLFILQSISQ